MLCTEVRCKAALLEARLFSRINNAVKPHTVAELASTDVCKHAQECGYGYIHSSPHSVLQLSISFLLPLHFSSLEVKPHIFLRAARCEVSPQAGEILAGAETLRPGLVSLEVTSILEEGKVGTRVLRATWREGWIFWGPS